MLRQSGTYQLIDSWCLASAPVNAPRQFPVVKKPTTAALVVGVYEDVTLANISMNISRRIRLRVCWIYTKLSRWTPRCARTTYLSRKTL